MGRERGEARVYGPGGPRGERGPAAPSPTKPPGLPRRPSPGLSTAPAIWTDRMRSRVADDNRERSGGVRRAGPGPDEVDVIGDAAGQRGWLRSDHGAPSR